MTIFQRAGAFLKRAYDKVPVTLQRGLESVVFTGAGVGTGELLNTYSKLPFAHTAAGTIVGALTITPFLRIIQMYFIARANADKEASGLPLANVQPVPVAPESTVPNGTH